MALVSEEPACALMELELGDSPESLVRLVESQRALFHTQIDQLQKLVVAQCRLTGVNPLAQEMAAGALSIRIGKRPRDLMNPKAIKYMQCIFSIKDTIGKKETREISALCGVTISQVREFFAGQRSRVRKLVRLSCENSTKSDTSKTAKDEFSFDIDQPLPINIIAPSGNAASAIVTGQQLSGTAGIVGTVKIDQQMTPRPNEILKVDEGRSSQLQEETTPGVDSDDKEFLDKIFNMMRKEQSFAGQVKLMEWILRIQNTAILNWFSNNGGAHILATWLSQAADEEQTTVLLVILKVLYHLPLHKALPLHMSAIVPAVNRLRFYRTSDISNKARMLLSRWSKVFIKSQALKRSHITSSKTALTETIHSQRICGYLDDQFLQANLDIPEGILALTGDMEISRESEPKQALKLLPLSADSSKKHDRRVSATKSKERRKVLLVEQLDHKAASKSAQVVRTVASNHSRPMSADDIQKAKMRAMFMQHKYGKADPSSSKSQSQKIEDLQPATVSRNNNMISECKLPHALHVVKEESSIQTVSTEDNLANKIKTSNSRPNSAPKQDCYGILSCKPIQWRIPQEMSISSTWSVGTGQNSKEFDVQTHRNRREKESLYSCLQDIPPNPKEPWDMEMDFDDSLTPEIPSEQPPDVEVEEEPACSNPKVEASASLAAPVTTTASAPSTSDAAPEPDLELLAVLLKNPDLVFALTSNQGKSLSNGEMVALLDMLKKNGVGLTALLNELANEKEHSSSHETKSQQEQELPASLPSPTPPSEAARSSAWKADFPTFSKTPVLQPHFLGKGAWVAQQTATGLQPHPQVAVLPVVVRPPAQPPATVFPMPPLNTVASTSANQKAQSTNYLPERLPSPSPPPGKPSYTYPFQQTTTLFDVDSPSKRFPATNTAFISSVPRRETFGISPTISGLPTLPTVSHTVQRSEPPTLSHTAPPWAAAAPATVRRDPTPDRLMGRASGALEISTSNQRYVTSQSVYGVLPNGCTEVHSGQRDRNGFVDRELHTWRFDDSPVRRRSPEISSGRSYNDEPRRDGRSNRRPDDWSRQWGLSNRDRDRDRDRERERDLDRERDRDRDRYGKRWRDHNHGRRR